MWCRSREGLKGFQRSWATNWRSRYERLTEVSLAEGSEHLDQVIGRFTMLMRKGTSEQVRRTGSKSDRKWEEGVHYEGDPADQNSAIGQDYPSPVLLPTTLMSQPAASLSLGLAQQPASLPARKLVDLDGHPQGSTYDPYASDLSLPILGEEARLVMPVISRRRIFELTYAGQPYVSPMPYRWAWKDGGV